LGDVITVSSLDVARARLALGTLQSGALPDVAAELLEAGQDTPSLRVLAGSVQPVMSDVGPVFEHALRELGLAPLDKQQALRVLMRRHAHAILSGEVEPYEGARLIWDDISHEYEPFDEISAFVGAASQIEDYRQMALSRPDPYLGYIEACTRDIQDAAREYLGGVPPTV
jgi:hypothetical protein